LDERTIYTCLRSEERRYHRLKRTAPQRRRDFLFTLAVAKAEHSGGDPENIHAQLIHVEEQRTLFRRLKYLQSHTRHGITQVRIQEAPGQWKDCVTKETIETACLQENQQRFLQAAQTPFLQEPLLSLFGALGQKEAVGHTIEGTLEIPPNCDEYAAALLSHMVRPYPVKSVPSLITETEFVQLWTKAKERTSSGPSSIHFGHFKAYASSAYLTRWATTMMNIPYLSGYSPNRWRRGVNVMLEKKAGVVDVDKLRTILLFEGDFNATNKITGRRMMANAEAHNLIAPEQYGSRKNHTAIAQVLNKVLTYDALRLRRAPGALCSNDAKSCYDHIVHSVAKLAMFRCGILPHQIDLMFSTIQRMHHFIRTAFGDSTACFKGDQLPSTSIIHGVGQGNGAGPAMWAVLSSPIINMLRSLGFGVKMVSAISKEVLHLAAYSFVDDTDIPQAADNHQGTEEVLRAIQDAINAWEGGLKATGGALVPPKCHWFFIDFHWHQGHPRYKTIAQLPGDLTMHNHNGQRITIERLEPNTATKSLGVFVAPDGNCQQQADYMQSQALRWADTTRTSGLDRLSTWTFFNTTLLKQLEYPLPATTLTEAQCDRILRPSRMALLPLLGINRNLPLVITYGPTKRGGLQIPNIYTQHGIAHIKTLISYGQRSNDPTGKLLRACIEQHKLEVGLGQSLFSHPYKILSPILTKTWISHTWEFLDRFQLYLEEDTPSLRLHRQGDQFLMAAFIQTGYRGASLHQLNSCRLFLQVNTLSDLATASGNSLRKSSWLGVQDHQQITTLEWPRQQEPQQWQLWRSALTTTFHVNPNTLSLLNPLGPWFSHVAHLWQYSPTYDRLVRYHQGQYESFPRQPQRGRTRQARRRFQTTPVQIQSTLRAGFFQPATVYRHGSFWILQDTGTVLAPAEPETNDLLAITARAGSDLSWAWEYLLIEDQGLAVATSITQGNCFGVSDGSFKGDFGTAAWILVPPEGAPTISGCCTVPGQSTDQSAYRSELAGLFGMIKMTEAVCTAHQITAGSITLSCDGKGPLDRISKTSWVTWASEDHFDLISAIQNTILKLPITVKFHHVRGHQDIANRELDSYEYWNCAMDQMAKNHWQRRQAYPKKPSGHVHGEPWSIWANGHKLCKQLGTALQDIIHGPPCLDYWDCHEEIIIIIPKCLNFNFEYW
jgi:hypothetical protein